MQRGVFRKRELKARMGRNPATGEHQDSGPHPAAVYSG
jgi:nucleoid DNA-binding protein